MYQEKFLLNIENFSHGYIFVGGKSVENENFIKQFIKTVHCLDNKIKPCNQCESCKRVDLSAHEDVIFIRLEGASIGVKQIEQLQIQLKNKPYISKRIIGIIQDAEKMTIQAQNKLLKTLEEPAAGNIILLITESPQGLLETIHSRAALVRLSEGTIVPDDEIENISKRILSELMTGKKYYKLSYLIKDSVKDKNTALLLLESLEKKLRDILVLGYNENINLYNEKSFLRSFIQEKNISNHMLINSIVEIEKAYTDLQSGVNSTYCLKNLFLKFLELK